MQRAGGVADLAQVRGREGVHVDDEGAARRQIPDVRLEGRRVHRDEDVGLVTGRVNLVRREAQLEAGDSGQRAGWSADLGRIVRVRADVVAECGGRPGELGAGELHAVPGVAGKPDRDPLKLALFSGTLPDGTVLGRCHAPSVSWIRWCGRGGRLSNSSGNASARYLMMSTGRTTPTSTPASSTSGRLRYTPVCMRSIACRMG